MESKNERLQEYYDFTKDDLEENRHGRVTGYQKQVLQEKTQKEALRLFGVFAGVGILSFVVQARFSSSGSSFLPKILAVMLAVVVVSMVLRMIKRTNLSLSSVSGEVNFRWEEEKIRDPENIHSYTTISKLKMRVGGASFEVNEGLKKIIDQGDNCRFYYTGGGDIISAEYLGDRKD